MKKNNFISDFLSLLKSLDKDIKLKIYLSIIFMVISSFLEVLSIGSLIPFLTAILSPDKLFNNDLLKIFFDIEKYKDVNLQLIFTIIFTFSIVLSNLFRVFVISWVIKLSKVIGIKFATKIYDNTVHKSFNEIKLKNSSQVISLVTEKMESMTGVFFNFFNAASAMIICFAIFSFLFFLNPKITIILISVAILIYLSISITVRKKFSKNSLIMSRYSLLRIKHIRETFGGIKQILLDNSQNLYSKIFYKLDNLYRLTQAKNDFYSIFPRFLVEAVGIVAIAIGLYILDKTFNYEPLEIVTLVGALVFAAQKLLPLLHNVYISYGALLSRRDFIIEINDYIYELNKEDSFRKLSKDNQKDIFFNNKINLSNISFNYKNSDKKIINNFNVEIKKNSKTAVVGQTGSGKSTLLDLLMGLLEPIQGFIEIDGVKLSKNNIKFWQEKICHVPQDIFLLDSTIEQNIAFSLDDENIDIQKVIKSAKLAEIHNFIESLPDKYKTNVGENGILLSGGQKQRLGIARAFFKNKEIITLDEGTSALDFETENKIINNISKQKGLTIIQITHRLNKLTDYDHIIKL